MEFDVKIYKRLNGHMIIEDYSKDYDQYIPENYTVQQHDRYKYSESKTINVIMHISTNKETLVDVFLHNHDQLIPDPTDLDNLIYDVETTPFIVFQDGYYHIHHVVLPTMDWYENTYLKQNDEYRQYFDVVYVIGRDNKFYKIIDNQFTECVIEEILVRNTSNTTIQKCIIDVFYTGFLRECYVKHCKALFNKITKPCDYNCKPQDLGDLEFKRDFIWMLLNVLDYQIECGQYMESQRLLEMCTECSGFCNNFKSNEKHAGCGCA